MSYYTVYTQLLTFKISDPAEDSNSGPVDPWSNTLFNTPVSVKLLTTSQCCMAGILMLTNGFPYTCIL